MPHLRSEYAKARRIARQYILATSYRDCKKAETMCMLEREQVSELLDVPVVAVPDVMKGLVLVDARGEGSLQR